VSGKTTPFFIHLLRFLAFSDFSAYRRHHAVSTSYFGEGIVTEYTFPGVITGYFTHLAYVRLAP